MPVQFTGNDYFQGGNELGRYSYGELSPEQALQERAIARKQQIANILMSRGMKNAQQGGQMAGRFYVPASPVQNIAGLTEVLAGAIGGHVLDERSKAVGKEHQAMQAQAIQDYLASQRPTMQQKELEGPGAPMAAPTANDWVNTLTPAEHDADRIGQERARGGPGMVAEGPRPTTTVQQPADPTTARQGVVRALTSQYPPVRTMATFMEQQAGREKEHALAREQQLAMKKMQDDFLWKLTGKRADQAIELKQTVSGDVGVTQTGAASRTDLGKIQKINDLLLDMDPESPEAQGLAALRTKLSTHTPANSQTVNVDQGVPLVKELMVKGADNVAATLSQAQVAQQSLRSIQQVEDAMHTGKMVSGPGATPQIYLRQLGEVLGVGGKDNEEVLRNTRSAIQAMAKLQIDSSHAAQGQGAISDYERKLFERAAAGNNLTVPEISELMGAMRKTAQYTIGVSAQNVEKIRKLPKGGEVVAPFFELPGAGTPAPPRSQAPPGGIKPAAPAAGNKTTIDALLEKYK